MHWEECLWISEKKWCIILQRQLEDTLVQPDNSKIVTIRWTNGKGKQSSPHYREHCVLLMLWCNGCILGHWAALTAMVTIQCRANNGSDFCCRLSTLSIHTHTHSLQTKPGSTTYNSYCHSTASLASHSHTAHTHLHSQAAHTHSQQVFGVRAPY